MPVSNKKLAYAVKTIAKVMGRTAGEYVKAADGEWYPRKGTLMITLQKHTGKYCLVISHGGSWTAGTVLSRNTKAEIVKLADFVRLLDAVSATRAMKKLKGSRIRIW